MATRKRRNFSPGWGCGLRRGVAVITSVLLVTSQAAAVVDERQPSAAEIVQPVAKSYQELQQALTGPAPKTPLTPDQIAARLDNLFPTLEQAKKQIPRDTFDPQAIIDKVGKDPKKIFEWVRDNTYFVPYRGLLRGDKGVLMDRLGNSLDRAMLLYSLLRFVDQPVRMVRGTLTEAQATDVLAKVRTFPSFEQRTGSGSSSAATEEFVKQYAQQNHLDAARIRKALDELAAQQQRMKELVQKRVAAQAAMIAAAVGPPPANAAAEERAAQVKAVTDHWWVQWQNAGKWTDFDPTLPNAQLGQTLTEMQSNVSPKAYADVGEDLVHTVQIQVVIEVWKQGQVKEVPVLTQKLVPADLIGEPIVLRQIPVHWPQDQNLLQEKNALETFKKTVLAQTEWLPVLSVGSQNISKYSFDEHGDLNDSTLLGGQAVGGLGQVIGGMLGKHQIPTNQQKAAPREGSVPEAPQVTAEWIEYGINAPDRPSQSIRREIFDLVGPAARAARAAVQGPWITEALRLSRSLALIDQTQILPLVAQPSLEFLVHLTNNSLVSNRGVLSGLLRNTGSSIPETNQLDKLTPAQPSRLYNLALTRWSWSSNRNDLYLDRPNIFSYHKHLAAGEQGALMFREGLDIVENDLKIRRSSETDPFVARLNQGVLDTTAEALIAAASCPSSSVNCFRHLMNTSETYASDRMRGINWITIREDLDGHASGLPGDLRARVNEQVAQGFVAIIPVESGPFNDGFSWWRVNPRTGQILGIGEYGWGQAATEYALMLRKAALSVALLLCFLNVATSRKLKCAYERGERWRGGVAVGFCLLAFSAPWLIPKEGAAGVAGFVMAVYELAQTVREMLEQTGFPEENRLGENLMVMSESNEQACRDLASGKQKD